MKRARIYAVVGCKLGKESKEEIKNSLCLRENIIPNNIIFFPLVDKRNRKENIEKITFFLWLNKESYRKNLSYFYISVITLSNLKQAKLMYHDYVLAVSSFITKYFKYHIQNFCK